LRDQGQYAIAFSAENEECNKGSKYTGPDLKGVKDSFKKNEVYVHENLIAAKPKTEPKYTEHSEFRLQNYLKNLLEKEKCVIYFTVNSPCMKKCLEKGGRFNIENSIQLLQKEKNAAFVFKKIWDEDEKTKVIERLKEIAPNLPYYHCNTKCVKL